MSAVGSARWLNEWGVYFQFAHTLRERARQQFSVKTNCAVIAIEQSRYALENHFKKCVVFINRNGGMLCVGNYVAK